MPKFTRHLGAGGVENAEDHQEEEQALGVFEQQLHQKAEHQRGFEVLLPASYQLPLQNNTCKQYLQSLITRNLS